MLGLMAGFPGFSAVAGPRNGGGAHKMQKMVDFTIIVQLQTQFPGMPGFSRFLAVAVGFWIQDFGIRILGLGFWV